MKHFFLQITCFPSYIGFKRNKCSDSLNPASRLGGMIATQGQSMVGLVEGFTVLDLQLLEIMNDSLKVKDSNESFEDAGIVELEHSHI